MRCCYCWCRFLSIAFVTRLPALGKAERDAIVASRNRDAGDFAPLIEPLNVSFGKQWRDLLFESRSSAH